MRFFSALRTCGITVAENAWNGHATNIVHGHSWNAKLADFAQNGHPQEVLTTLKVMDLEGVQPDKFSLCKALTACAILGDLEAGRAIHAEVKTRGDLRGNFIIGTAIVNMYGKCGCLREAEVAFQEIGNRDVVSWSAMLAAYAQKGHSQEGAMLVFKKMLQDGVLPSETTFISVITACTSRHDIQEARHIHSLACENGYEVDGIFGGSLVNIYGKAGDLEAAKQVHDGMVCRNVVSWTALITAYAQKGHPRDALGFCTQMDHEGIKLNDVTFINLLGAFLGMNWLETGKALHFRALETGFQADGILGTALVNMYGKCGSISDAEETFDGIRARDTIAWNALLTAYAHLGHGRKACELYRRMLSEGLELDEVSFVSVLDACGDIEDLELGRQTHSCMAEFGLDTHEHVGSSLMNMYAKCRRLDIAREIFQTVIPLRGNLLAWNAMVAAYAQLGHAKEALEITQRLDLEGLKLDEATFLCVFSACSSVEFLPQGRMLHERMTQSCIKCNGVGVFNALINMYGKCGSQNEARLVFDGMKSRDIVTWNAMLAAYSQSDGNEALWLFHLMDLEGVKPDEVTFISMLAACASSRNLLAECKSLHLRAVACGFGASDAVNGLLINAYGKCGCLTNARKAFDNLPSRMLFSWTALIASYAQHSHAKDALDVYQNMHLEGLKPSQLTFITILCACSHSGLLHDGLRYFRSMVDDHYLVVLEDHYKCIADVFARSGQLGLAQDVIENMPFEPDNISWMTLISACHIQRDTTRASTAAANAFWLDPTDHQPLVALSNIYAS